MSEVIDSGMRAHFADPASHLAGMHHVGLTVSDVAASELWYSRVLGLRRMFEEPHYGGDSEGYAVILGAEGLPFNVGLDHHPGNAGERFDHTRTGLDHVSFCVPDRAALDSWTAHLTREGVVHSGVIAVDGTPFAVVNFRDPDGIALELICAE